MLPIIGIIIMIVLYVISKKEDRREELKNREEFESNLKAAIEERGKKLDSWKEYKYKDI